MLEHKRNTNLSKIIKKTLCFSLAITLISEIIPVTRVDAVDKVKQTEDWDYEELNDFDNTLENIDTYGIIKNSYLDKTDNGYQTVLVTEKIHIFNYDKNWNRLSEKILDFELPIFGGYYSGKKYNYFVFGQAGPDYGTEIYRIVKYDKNFNRISSLSVLYEDCYTSKPFSVGNVSIAESGNKMIVYTSRIRPDGHQSNIAIRINTDKMEIDNKYGMEYLPDIHVSHSFRQIVKYDGDTPIYVDLGDGYPRAVCLQEQPGKQTVMLDISGAIGDNDTGTDVSGLEITPNGYIVVGSQVRNYCNNIYLSYVEKGSTTAKVIWLTNSTIYNYSNVCNTRIVKISDNKYVVMWNCYDNGSDVNYVMVDNKGNIISSLKTLSDAEITQCEPILADGNIVWFKYVNGEQNVYKLNDFECKGTFELKDTYVEPFNEWNGEVDTSWYNNSWKEFVINRPEELAGLAKLVNEGNCFEGIKILLGKDMFFNGEDSIKNVWIPIGSEKSGISFEGTFDGQGHSLYNLYTNYNNGIGLFGVIGEKGIVKAVNISQGVMSGASVASINNGWIMFCRNSSLIDKEYGYSYIGGICRQNNNLIYGCENRGIVTGEDAGGIVGINLGKTATIDSCWNKGYVSGSGFCSAGIVSANYGYVNDCYNTGTVSGKTSINYAKTVTGIVGGNHRDVSNISNIKRCYNKGYLDINDEANWYCSNTICGEGIKLCSNIFSTPSKYNTYAQVKSIKELSGQNMISLIDNKGIGRWCMDKDNLNGGCIIPIAQQDLHDKVYKMLPDVWNAISDVTISLADKDYQLIAFSGVYYGIENAKAVYSSDSNILSISSDGIITPLKKGTAIVKVTFEETEHTKAAQFDVTVNIEGMPGDANGDGQVNSQDAVLIKKYLAEYDNVDINLEASDVNGDGEVTSADAVLLLKYLAEYDVTLSNK